MNTFLIVAFLYLIMCPFAHSFTPNLSATALLPQKETLNNISLQKDRLDSSPAPVVANQANLQVSNPTIMHISSSMFHKPFVNLTLMATSRLLL